MGVSFGLLFGANAQTQVSVEGQQTTSTVVQSSAKMPVIELQPPSLDVVKELADAIVELKSGELDKANQSLLSFLSTHRDTTLLPEALFWQGEYYYQSDQSFKAKRNYELIISLFPKDNYVPDALLRLATIYETAGETDKSEPLFARLTTIFADTPAAELYQSGNYQ